MAESQQRSGKGCFLNPTFELFFILSPFILSVEFSEPDYSSERGETKQSFF